MSRKVKTDYAVGDQVRYTSKFLQSVGGATGWPRVGKVVGRSDENPQWIRVEWDTNHTNLVSAANIMPKNRPDTSGL